jgi:hypothetical protein
MIARFAVAASIVCEGLAVYVLAEFLASGYGAEGQHSIGAWAFVLVAVAAWGLPRVVGGFAIEERAAHGITVGLAFLLMYSILRIEIANDLRVWDWSWTRSFLHDAGGSAASGGHALVGSVLLLAVWVRTSVRSGDEIEMESIPRTVGYPFLLVTVFVVLGAATGRSAEVGRGAAAFFAVAVIALACSQLAMSGTTIGEMRAGGITGVLLGGTVIASVIGVLLCALLLGLLGPVLGPILGAVVEAVLTAVLTPIAWILMKFFDLIFNGASPFPNVTQTAQQTAQDASNPKQAGESGFHQFVVMLLRGLALVIVAAAVAGLVAFFTRMRRRSARAASDGRTAAGAGGLGDDLRGLFRSLFSRSGARDSLPSSSEAVRLYREVLERAEATGRPREAAVTPAEFAPVLSETFQASVTDDITRAFEQARYAGREPGARELGELQQRWRAVR